MYNDIVWKFLQSHTQPFLECLLFKGFLFSNICGLQSGSIFDNHIF